MDNTIATLWRLPEGEGSYAGVIKQRHSNRVEIDMSAPVPFPLRTPVVISIDGKLMLGMLLAQQGDRLSIFIEHEVDTLRVKRILNVWHPSEVF